MCLSVKNKTHKVKATKDKVVYKLLYKSTVHTYMTPFQYMVIKMNETYTIDKNKLTIMHSAYRGDIVEYGYHSMKTLEGAKFIKHMLVDDNNPNMIIVECVIPANAYYYKGTFNGCVSYTSTAIKYNKIVTN